MSSHQEAFMRTIKEQGLVSSWYEERISDKKTIKEPKLVSSHQEAETSAYSISPIVTSLLTTLGGPSLNLKT